MKENIEEVVERLEKSINDVWFSTTYSQEDEERDLRVLLSDYKRVLKENEELLREKIDNKKIIALAQNEFLGYEQGYQDGKAGRGSAIQAIIEGQQYYIIQEQIERYKNQIEKLQKENKELKRLLNGNLYEDYKYYKNLAGEYQGNCISKQKVRDEIEYINKFEEDLYKKENIIQVLQELLEEKEDKR